MGGRGYISRKENRAACKKTHVSFGGGLGKMSNHIMTKKKGEICKMGKEKKQTRN